MAASSLAACIRNAAPLSRERANRTPSYLLLFSSSHLFFASSPPFFSFFLFSFLSSFLLFLHHFHPGRYTNAVVQLLRCVPELRAPVLSTQGDAALYATATGGLALELALLLHMMDAAAAAGSGGSGSGGTSDGDASTGDGKGRFVQPTNFFKAFRRAPRASPAAALDNKEQQNRLTS